ncbi:MAG: hypothetical protein RCG15_05975 [Candidatus Rickettsia vulgarisii]
MSFLVVEESRRKYEKHHAEFISASMRSRNKFEMTGTVTRFPP